MLKLIRCVNGSLAYSSPTQFYLCRYIHGNPVKDGLVAAPSPSVLRTSPPRGENVSRYARPVPSPFGGRLGWGRGRDFPDDIKRYLDEFGM